MLGAASDRDQDQKRENDRAGRHKLAAQDARMHGDAAGECEGQRRQHGNAPVAHHAANQGCEDQHAAGRDQEGEQAPGAHRAVMAASKAAALDAGGIAASDQASSRPSACSS